MSTMSQFFSSGSSGGPMVGEIVQLPTTEPVLTTIGTMEFLRSGNLLEDESANYPDAYTNASWGGYRWTSRTSNLTGNVNNVYYLNDLYIATTSNNGQLSTSSDGLTWTLRTSQFGATEAIQQVVYANGIYVAVGGTTTTSVGRITSSTNGTTWTSRLSAATVRFNGVIYANGLFVAWSGTANTLYTSPDGITWTSRAANFGTNVIANVIYANSLFVAVGGNGSNTAALSTSSDGITWTSRSTGLGTTIEDIIYEGSTFVICGPNGAVGTNLATSTNGISWTAQSTTSNVKKLAYFNRRYIFATTTGNVWASSDATNWTQQTTTSIGSVGATPIASGNGSIVVVSNGGFINTVSRDGLTWRTFVASTTIFPNRVFYLNNQFIAFSGFGIVVSTDGQNWINRATYTELFGGTTIIGVALANTFLFAYSSSGRLSSSPTGNMVGLEVPSFIGSSVSYMRVK